MMDKFKWSHGTEDPIRMIDGKIVLTMYTADYLGTLNENQDSICWDDGDVWERELVKTFQFIMIDWKERTKPFVWIFFKVPFQSSVR